MQLKESQVGSLIEAPACPCGAEMHLSKVLPREDVEVHVFGCNACHHELRLMVWKSSEPQERQSPSVQLDQKSETIILS